MKNEHVVVQWINGQWVVRGRYASKAAAMRAVASFGAYAVVRKAGPFETL